MKKKNISLYQGSVILPEKVQVERVENSFIFSGPLGSTKFHLKKVDSLKNDKVIFSLENDSIKITSTSKALLGLYKTLLENKCVGVSRGYLIYLKIVGIGYRASFSKDQKDLLIFKLGYSHDISYQIPSGIRVFLQNPGSLCLFGVDKNQLTQIAASIRSLRKPGVYKNKGIQLSTEKLQFKSGKKK